MYKKIVFSLLVIMFLAASAVSPVKAQDTQPGDRVPGAPLTAGIDARELWFVELAGAPTIDGASIDTVNVEHTAFRAQAEKAGIVLTERFAYTSLFNGFSVAVKTSDLAALSRLPGVKRITPVLEVPMPETIASNLEPQLFSSLEMIGATVAQSELGLTGTGVKVAVMDTGIDVNHPAFGGDGVADENSTFFYESPRILYGYDFVGDAYDANPDNDTYNITTMPDDIPDDCAGHGTHVAGIIGANDAGMGMVGVAPGVTFGAYRVFGCNGSTNDDIMLAAMERALADGMQVLNMSIGSAFAWPQSPTAVAASKLVENGMVVVASIGNSGQYGLFAAGAPGLGKEVIGVASYDNSDVLLPYFTVGTTAIGYQTMTFSPEPPLSGSFEIVDIGTACTTPLPVADLTGKVALAKRGTCAFSAKALNAISIGAVGVLVYNNVPGVVSGTLGAPLPPPADEVPVVGISKADGEFIIAQTAPVTMTWTEFMDLFPSPTGGLISSFSSYGLSPDLDLKPDLGAPGGNIFSSYPLEYGGYAVLSGTSMASPHVAGAAALLLEAKPGLKAKKVRGILQNSAVPALWSGNTSYGLLDYVHRQGAGMIQIDDAILSDVTVTPSKIALGESQKGPVTKTLKIKNAGDTKVKYTLSYENALTSEGIIAVVDVWDSDAKVKFSAKSVTVPAKSSATVTVTIKPSTYPVEFGMYGGYIILTPADVTLPTLRVPYAGWVGDYQDIMVMAYEPELLISFGGDYYTYPDDPANWPYWMQGEDVPYFWVNLEHQAQKLDISIFDATTNKNLGVAYTETLLPRASLSGYGYIFPFDGYVMKKGVLTRVPDGLYYAKIKVLKANGDPAKAADWEKWTSPDFLIDRPGVDD